jgi:cytoskeletal protein CcmA (bactofilin family)
METAEKTTTVIGEQVEIVGSIKAAVNVQFDGKLNGDMTCTGDVVVGASAAIKGNLSVENITVLGQINGNVAAKDKIELKSSARVTGDVRSRRMSVEDGVTFIGKSEVNPNGAPARSSGIPVEVGDEGARGEVFDESVASLKEEIRKNVKEEVKTKSGGIFGRK